MKRGEHWKVAHNVMSQPTHRHDHAHHTLLYESQTEQFETVVPFIQDGLDAGDRCVYVAHDNTVDEIADAFEDQHVDGTPALETDQFTILHADELYVTEERFDPDRMIDRLEGEIAATLDAGYDRVRIAGEMTWVMEHDVDLRRFETYERYVDDLFPTDAFIGLCQFRRSRFPPDVLDSMLKVHPQIAHEDEHVSNCHYVSGWTPDGATTRETIDRKLDAVHDRKDLSDSLREQKRQLSILGDSTEQLRGVERDEIERLVGDMASETLDSAVISLCRYDREAGTLETQVLRETIRNVGAEDVLAELDDHMWEAFVENERREFAVEVGRRITGVICPIGRYGVLLVGVPHPNTITETDVAFLKSLGEHRGAVLNRMGYERALEEKNAELRERNDRLDRINGVNSVIREINKSIVRATTQEEITRRVCELLVEGTSASFAWYGDYDPATETVDPKQWAGDDQGYLDALAVEDAWSDHEPAGTAARSQSIEVVNDIYDGPPLRHWKEQALKRNFKSAVGLPVSFDDSLYGVLALYSDTPGDFDEEIASVLDELSDSVAHAINSIKRKHALVTETVSELTVRVTDTKLPIVEFVERSGCHIELDEIVSTDDDRFRLFSTIHGASAEEIRAFVRTSPSIDEADLLSEDEPHMGQFVISSRCLMAALLNHNTIPQSVSVEGDKVHLVVHLPQDQNTREFMQMLRTKYPAATLVSRTERKRPRRRVADIGTGLESELTERQLEVLKIAYQSGYFERPRKRTAEEVADALDVTHPTVSRHLREAERRIFSLLFDDDADAVHTYPR